MSSIDGSYSEDFLGDGSSMVGRQRHSSTPISTGSSVEPDFPDDLSAIGDADDDSQSVLSDEEWGDRIDWRAMLDTHSQRPSSPTSSVGASGILSDLVTEDGGYSAWSDGDSEEVRGADAEVASYAAVAAVSDIVKFGPPALPMDESRDPIELDQASGVEAGNDSQLAATSMDSNNSLVNAIVGGLGVDFWSFKTQHTTDEGHATDKAPSAKRPRRAPGAGAGSGE